MNRPTSVTVFGFLGVAIHVLLIFAILTAA